MNPEDAYKLLRGSKIVDVSGHLYQGDVAIDTMEILTHTNERWLVRFSACDTDHVMVTV